MPTRRICASPFHKGPRWLLAHYFYRDNKHSTGLQAYCATCTKIRMRHANLSERIKRARNNYSREYKARERRARDVPRRTLHNPRFNGPKLYAYLERFIVLEVKTKEESRNNKGGQWSISDNRTKAPASRPRMLLNGIPVSTSDQRYISSLKLNKVQRAPLKRIDEMSIKYDLPLWEMQDAAGCYKEDIRTIRRKRRKV